MKSTRSSFRQLAQSFRNRGNKPEGQDQSQGNTLSDASFEGSYDYQAEREEVLARQDPLLPDLLGAVKDYQLTHGSLIKLTPHPATKHLPIAYTVLAQPIGVSLIPTLWPEERFHEAWDLQPVLQELYAKVASDPEYLWDVLKDCIACDRNHEWSDQIVFALWKIYEAVRDDTDGLGQVQDVELGLCRGDWMLNIEPPSKLREDITSNEAGDRSSLAAFPSLKQVELNTVATAGASHSSIVSQMHNHLLGTRIYSQLPSLARQASTSFCPLPFFPPFPKLAPNNSGIQAFAHALAEAHSLYGSAKSGLTPYKAVLMIVQHNNVNIADERPIEYALWNMQPPIPCFRCEYRDVMDKTYFAPLPKSRNLVWQKDQTGRELIFTPYSGGDLFEISVVYHRGSMTAEELLQSPFPKADSLHSGFQIRKHLERSRAIKCPTVFGHLASSKKVQQHLTSVPGAMERFIGLEAAQRLRERSMAMISLADPSSYFRQILDECIPPPGAKTSPDAIQSAMKAAERALAPYVLKPIGAEGGGHCVFGSDIPEFYTTVIAPAKSQAGHVLMQRIHPSVVRGALISQRRYHVAPVVSELGILGTCMWHRHNSGMGNSNPPEAEGGIGTSDGSSGKKERHGGIEMISNESVGWTLKSKPEDVPEVSVIKGYGCFDTPCLVSWAMYQAQAKEGVKDWE